MCKVVLGNYYAPVYKSRKRNHNKKCVAVDLEQVVHALVLCHLYHYRNQTDQYKHKEEKHSNSSKCQSKVFYIPEVPYSYRQGHEAVLCKPNHCENFQQLVFAVEVEVFAEQQQGNHLRDEYCKRKYPCAFVNKLFQERAVPRVEPHIAYVAYVEEQKHYVEHSEQHHAEKVAVLECLRKSAQESSFAFMYQNFVKSRFVGHEFFGLLAECIICKYKSEQEEQNKFEVERLDYIADHISEL